ALRTDNSSILLEPKKQKCQIEIQQLASSRKRSRMMVVLQLHQHLSMHLPTNSKLRSAPQCITQSGLKLRRYSIFS
ncbi:unnamed protein product, partial [Amoebophrya sp. A25]